MSALAHAARVVGLHLDEIVLPQDRHVALRGLRFHYLDWGGAGRPILFLHGGGLTAHTFDLVCLQLRKDHRPLALDQRGHGDSDWSPTMDYSHSAHAHDIGAFVEYMGLRDLAIVGMSMGGLNALKYAAGAQDRVAGVALIDIGPDIQEAGADRIRAFMKGPRQVHSLEEFIARAVTLNPRRDPALLRRSLLHNLQQLPDGRWTWKWDARRDLDPQRGAEERSRLWDEVDRLTRPTLVVRGANSDVFSRENAERLVGRLPQGRLVEVDNAGHSVQGDNPVGLARAIAEFLAQLPRVGAS